jgi:hypothetical protein
MPVAVGIETTAPLSSVSKEPNMTVVNFFGFAMCF